MATTVRPKLSPSFTQWGGRNYIVFRWDKEGHVALSVEIQGPLDDARKQRLTAHLAGIVKELQ